MPCSALPFLAMLCFAFSGPAFFFFFFFNPFFLCFFWPCFAFPYATFFSLAGLCFALLCFPPHCSALLCVAALGFFCRPSHRFCRRVDRRIDEHINPQTHTLTSPQLGDRPLGTGGRGQGSGQRASSIPWPPLSGEPPGGPRCYLCGEGGGREQH